MDLELRDDMLAKGLFFIFSSSPSTDVRKYNLMFVLFEHGVISQDNSHMPLTLFWTVYAQHMKNTRSPEEMSSICWFEITMEIRM